MRPQSKNKQTGKKNRSPAGDWFKFCTRFVEREKVACIVKLVLSSHMQRMTWWLFKTVWLLNTVSHNEPIIEKQQYYNRSFKAKIDYLLYKNSLKNITNIDFER